VRLSGTEILALEIEGALEGGVGEELVRTSPPFAVERDAEGRARVAILALSMKGLKTSGVPGPRFDYLEVLYRLGIVFEGHRAWLAVRCDIDRGLVRSMARAIIKYPVRAATIAIADDGKGGLTVDAGDALRLRASYEDGAPAPDPVKPRRTFVAHRGRLYEVPWDELPAPRRASVAIGSIDVADGGVFGSEIAFAPSGVAHWGRTHICGPARAVMR
jgi:hypothetical protein